MNFGDCDDRQGMESWPGVVGPATSHKDLVTLARRRVAVGGNNRDSMVRRKVVGSNPLDSDGSRVPAIMAHSTLGEWLGQLAGSYLVFSDRAPSTELHHGEVYEHLMRLIAAGSFSRTYQGGGGLEISGLKSIDSSVGLSAPVREGWTATAKRYFVKAQKAASAGHQATIGPMWLIGSIHYAYVASPVRVAPEIPEPSWFGKAEQVLLTAKHLVEEEANNVARAAIDDLRGLAQRERLPSPKSMNVSEEGLFSIVWESADRALLIVLTGDGDASYSVKATGGFFETITDFALRDGLPASAREVLETSAVP